jgi:hypothetical protein
VRSWLSCDCGEVSWPTAPFRACSLVGTSNDFWREREGGNSGRAGYHCNVIMYKYIYNILTNILFIL